MDSGFAKLGRAKAHLASLNDSIDNWRAGLEQEWRVVATDCPLDKSQAILKFFVTFNQQPPDDWGLIIGDILTTLRAALDHSIVSHAASRQILVEEQEQRLHFPILQNQSNWLGSPGVPDGPTTRGRRKINSARDSLADFLDPAVLDVVEQAQPFTMDPPEQHALAELNRLVNLDKHRAMRVVTLVHEAFEVNSADLEVLSIDAPPISHSEDAPVATLRIRRRTVDQPDQVQPVDVGVHFTSTSYEALELPSDGLPEEVRHVMGTLIEQIEEVLECLRAVGC